MRLSRIGVLCLVLCLVACSPTFNWRNVALEGAPLQAQMPCKPERAERQVPLTASGVSLRLMSCEAGGLTFALAWAAVGTSDGADVVLDRWQRAGWSSLRQPVPTQAGWPQGWAAWPAEVARAQHVRGWQGPGLDHEGRTVAAQQVYFSHGAVVYQAAVYGPRIDAAAAEPFFEALRLPETR